MKKRRSVLTFAVVLALAVMLGSCSGAPGNTAQSAKPDASSGGGSESSVQTEEVDPLGKYDEEITITFFGQKDDSVKFKEGEDWDNNLWTEHYKDKLNIKTEYKWIVDSTQ